MAKVWILKLVSHPCSEQPASKLSGVFWQWGGKRKESWQLSLEFEFHVQFPCGSLSTELLDFCQSAQSGNEREWKQTLKNRCQGQWPHIYKMSSLAIIMLLCILIERWFTSSEYSTVCQSYIDTTFLIFCLWQQGVHWDMTTFCRLNLMTDWWFKILSMFYCIVGSGTPVHVELVPWNTHTDYATQV